MAGNVVKAANGKPLFRIRGGPRSPLGGMKPDGDPTSLAPNDFIYLQNARRVGGLIVSRGGQAAFVNLTSEPLGMVDFQNAGTGLSGIGAGVGLFATFLDSLYEYSLEQQPRLQPRVSTGGLPGGGEYRTERIDHEYDESDEGDVPSMHFYLVADANGVVYRVESVDPGYGIDSADVGSYTLTPLFTIPSDSGEGLPFAVRHIVALEESVYLFGLTSGGAVSAVFSWNGQTVEKLETFTAATDAAARFRDGLLAFNGTDLVGMDSDGVWSSLATTVDDVSPRAIISYSDSFYFAAPWGDVATAMNIYAWDGTAITTYPPATTGISNEVQVKVFSLCSLRGVLYYVWGAPSEVDTEPLQEFYVGRFDGTTWDATWKNLLLDFPYAASLGVFPSVAFQDSLFIGAQETDLGEAVTFYQSPTGGETDGTWVKIYPPDPDPGYVINLEVH